MKVLHLSEKISITVIKGQIYDINKGNALVILLLLIRYVSNTESSLKDVKVFCEITCDSLKSEIALFIYIVNVRHSTENILERGHSFLLNPSPPR